MTANSVPAEGRVSAEPLLSSGATAAELRRQLAAAFPGQRISLTCIRGSSYLAARWVDGPPEAEVRRICEPWCHHLDRDPDPSRRLLHPTAVTAVLYQRTLSPATAHTAQALLRERYPHLPDVIDDAARWTPAASGLAPDRVVVRGVPVGGGRYDRVLLAVADRLVLDQAGEVTTW